MNFTRRAALIAGAGLALPGAARALDSASFPFRVTRNRPWTVAAINGQDPPLPFLLDTGAGWYAITDKAAADLKLPRVAREQARGVVGRFDAAIYRVSRVKVGGVMEDRDLYMGGLPHPLGGDFQGLVPATRTSVMGFDFDAQQISVARRMTDAPEGYRSLAMDLGVQLQGSADPLGVQARTDFSHNNMDLRPVVPAMFDGQPVKLMLDTGYAGGLYLYPSYVKAKGLWEHYPAPSPGQVRTTAGLANVRIARAERLKLGNLVFAKPIVQLGDPADADRDNNSIEAGIVGMEFLRRLNFIYDPIDRQVWLKPNSAVADGYRYNRAGADVAIVEGQLRVVDLAPGGPADQAGLKDGDLVSGWRGADGYDGLVWALTGAPGSVVEIQVQRDGKPQMVAVTLVERL